MAATLTLRTIAGQTLASHRLDTPLVIRAQNQVQYLLADDSGMAANAIAERAGNDLLVNVDGKAALRIEDYFLFDDTGLANPLLGMNGSGQYVAYPVADAALPVEHLLAGEMAGTSASGITALAILGGVALSGAAIAASGKEKTTADPLAQQPQTPFDPNQPALPPADNGNVTPPPSDNGNITPPPSGGGNNPPPTTPTPNGKITISGEAVVGKTLTAIITDPDGTPANPQYQWFANGQPIQGARQSTYTLTANEKDARITVQATYTDNKNTAENPLSAATHPVADNIPAPQNHAPTDLDLSALQLPENRPGAVIGQITVTDPDQNDTHSFTVNDPRFEITADGVLKLKAGEKIDFANEQNIPLTVTVTDKAGEQYSESFTLEVQDDPNYPAPPANDRLGVHVPKPATDFTANAKDYGARGDGQSDDTAAIQKAIDAVAAKGGGIVDIPDGRYLVDAEVGIRLRSHVIVRMADGTVLKAKANAAPSHEIFHIHNVTDAHILGGTLEGERSEHRGSGGEWGMGIRVTASTHIVIEKVTVREMWGDGIYLGKAANYPQQNENIVIYGVNMDHNRRQGISVTQAKGVKILDSVLQNSDGTEPRAGIDLEPNANENVSDVEIRGNTFANNQIGFLVANHHHPTAWVKNVIFEDNLLRDNPRDAIILRGLDGGSIRNNTIHIDPDAHPHESGGIRLYNGDHQRTTGVNISGNTLYGGEILPRDTSGNTIADNQFKAAVFIRGEARAGETLTAAVYDGDHFVEDDVRYQWYADGNVISGETGKTYTVKNADAQKTLTVAVQFTDKAGHSESAVSVQGKTAESGNNHAPTDLDLSALQLPENRPGAVIGKLTVTDPDQNDTHSFTVNDPRFEITTDGVLKLKAGEKIDFANEQNIPLIITVTDKAGATYQETFTLNVIDDPNYPAPSTKESGLNLDIARHFYPLPVLKAFVDTLANAGGSFLHLHLSDNENYALESALLGQTTADASQRADGVWIHNHTQKPFLSNAQIAELVAHAQAKNIALVPELDMPAHIQGVFDLLRHARGDAYVDSIRVDWTDANGQPVQQLDVNRAEARTFAKALLDEIGAHLQNPRHIHIGGDEFHGAEAHNHEYIAFANDLAAHLAARGSKTRMWNDGILKTALATLNPAIEITYWNFDGDKQGDEAAHNRLVRASLPELLDAGYTVLNYNNAYLYHVPEAHNYSSFSQSDHEMYTRLKEWHLGLWDGKDNASAITDSTKIAGAAMSIWGDSAGALDPASIEKFTESQLAAIIRMVNAAADPQSADARALKTLQNALRDGDYSGIEHPVYLDLDRAPQNGSLDTGALGTQHIRLLREDILDNRDNFEFFIRGDRNDTLALGNHWQKSGDTLVRINPDYPADQVTYHAYSHGDDRLWIDQDLHILML